jgi:hypothetical protein
MRGSLPEWSTVQDAGAKLGSPRRQKRLSLCELSLAAGFEEANDKGGPRT